MALSNVDFFMGEGAPATPVEGGIYVDKAGARLFIQTDTDLLVFDGTRIGVELPKLGTPLNECSWEQIPLVSRKGLASTYWNVGAWKETTLQGLPHKVFIFGFNCDAPDSITFGLLRHWGDSKDRPHVELGPAPVDGNDYWQTPISFDDKNHTWTDSSLRTEVYARWLSEGWLEAGLQSVVRPVVLPTPLHAEVILGNEQTLTLDTIFPPDSYNFPDTNNSEGEDLHEPYGYVYPIFKLNPGSFYPFPEEYDGEYAVWDQTSDVWLRTPVAGSSNWCRTGSNGGLYVVGDKPDQKNYHTICFVV